MIKNEHKNKPVKHIISFLPRVEENVFEKLLIIWYLKVFFRVAKVFIKKRKIGMVLFK
jgi:hypothetical protein